MQLTLFSDLSLRVLMYLASRKDPLQAAITARGSASLFNVSYTHMVKVVRGSCIAEAGSTVSLSVAWNSSNAVSLCCLLAQTLTPRPSYAALLTSSAPPQRG